MSRKAREEDPRGITEEEVLSILQSDLRMGMAASDPVIYDLVERGEIHLSPWQATRVIGLCEKAIVRHALRHQWKALKSWVIILRHLKPQLP